MYRRFVIGDIHGCIKTLSKLLFGVLNLDHKDLLFLLGDYIDRGPSGKAVIDLLINLSKEDYNIFPLRGNHEQMLLDYYFYENNSWLYNGYQPTLESFGIGKLYEMKDYYIHFFNNLKYYYITDGFIMTHAGLNSDINNPLSDSKSMMWTRESYYNKRSIGGKRLISGHTPHKIQQIEDSLLEDKIQLDGGCVYAGKHSGMGYLCALELDNLQLYSQENIDIDEEDIHRFRGKMPLNKL